MLHSNVPMLTMSSSTLQKWVRESARVAGMVNKQSSRSEMAKLIRKMLRGVLITWGTTFEIYEHNNLETIPTRWKE